MGTLAARLFAAFFAALVLGRCGSATPPAYGYQGAYAGPPPRAELVCAEIDGRLIAALGSCPLGTRVVAGTPDAVPPLGNPDTVHVRGYYRRDGTYVRPHYRHAPR